MVSCDFWGIQQHVGQLNKEEGSGSGNLWFHPFGHQKSDSKDVKFLYF